MCSRCEKQQAQVGEGPRGIAGARDCEAQRPNILHPLYSSGERQLEALALIGALEAIYDIL